MKMTLDKKILAGFIACSAVLLLVAVISFQNSEKLINANRAVTHTQEVIYECEQILLNTVLAESCVRGYIVSNDELFLQEVADARRSLTAHIGKMRDLTSDNPDQQANIDLIEAAALRRIEHLERCITLGQNGELELAQQLVSSGEGRTLQNNLRILVEGAVSIENELLEQRKSTSERDARNFNLLFLVLGSAILGTLLIGYLVIMRNIRALRKAELDTNAKNWFLDGSSQLVGQIQGNKNTTELAGTILSFFARYINTPLGTLYIRDRNSRQLVLKGAYALDIQKVTNSPAHSAFAAQVAHENRKILLKDIPPDAYSIASTFGSITPKSIIGVPLSLDGKLVGVMELGSLNDFTDAQREFLRITSDSIAIALASAQAREEISELLEETQRQAEELEAQQHELRQANEELQTKTDLLEQSEAMLKVQQEELQQANTELEEKANILEEQKDQLEQATNALEAKARELSLSSKYKSEFLANMSHELRTPLNSILILSQLLGENKNKKLSEKEIEHARNIHNSGKDLLNLINEILDLSKVESGKMQLDITEFTVDEIIQNLRSTFDPVAASNSVKFTVTCKDRNTMLTSDIHRVEQILKNFLSNAFKFTPEKGSVTLTVEQPSPTQISFAVRDTGIGIPEDKRQIIFEAFQQADGSTKRKYGGTGLGLSISRQLAQVLGGSIHLESQEGKGSTFKLVLPLAFEQQEAPVIEEPVHIRETTRRENGSPATEAPAHHEHNTMNARDDRNTITENDRVILIIEDDEKFGDMLLAFVRERNYKGILTSEGTTGISYARHYRPDAILLDMKLPVMDGFEVLTRLKSDPGLRHIPVQIISGYDRQKESLASGAFDYLMKPVETEQLSQALDRIELFTSRKLKKLLVIEDNAQQNQAIRELIGNGDVRSYSAHSGTEAQNLLLKEHFDCIIVDLGLPDMSGFDLLERIKANEKLRSIPVIVYTGRDLKKEEATKLKRLSDSVVLKTVSSHERLLDETTLFLHRVESNLPKEKQLLIRKLHRSDEVLKGKTVLIADDDIRNIYSLTNVLEEEGVNCLTAENGRVALEMLKSGTAVDMVLMDIMMPEMDGYEATLEIRKIEKFKKLPIIAITAKAMKGDKEKCLSVGMSDYVSKPVDVEQLLSLMRVWLYR